mmetsp:Transcript_6232/g.14365  ORF Transcript_6232/g.14365 Transcript_6232/m.14365 type:complete len:252 (-) Transcript_6232:42-797(-)
MPSIAHLQASVMLEHRLLDYGDPELSAAAQTPSVHRRVVIEHAQEIIDDHVDKPRLLVKDDTVDANLHVIRYDALTHKALAIRGYGRNSCNHVAVANRALSDIIPLIAINNHLGVFPKVSDPLPPFFGFANQAVPARLLAVHIEDFLLVLNGIEVLISVLLATSLAALDDCLNLLAAVLPRPLQGRHCTQGAGLLGSLLCRIDQVTRIHFGQDLGFQRREFGVWELVSSCIDVHALQVEVKEQAVNARCLR